MPFTDELQFEAALINLLTSSCGWEKEVIKNPTEEDLIKNWAQILYDNNKEQDVLNGCPLTEGEMNQILTQVNTLKTPLALNNFINGKTVSITRDNQNDALHFGKKVSLRIYDRLEIAGGKSRYQIVEQPKFKTNNTVYPTRRGDIILLINGMPVFHIELKRSNVSITQAEVQIEKYMVNGCFTGIFSLVQIFIAVNPEEAVYFANPGSNGKFNPEFYFHWEDFNNDIVNDWKEFTSQVLSIPMAHEMVGFYTIADDSDGCLKVMRSYQCIAAYKICDKVTKSSWTKNDQHGGFVWHTTGSGKTMTSFKAAQLIAQSKDADKVVFLLDRVELGDQSLINYRNFANPNETVQATEDTNTLISKLRNDDADSVLIVTSIQKMSRIKDDNGVKTSDLKKIKSKKIVFIIDECHRDQKGEMHQSIKQTFPNAMYFGFTGTPDWEYTADIFGDELHRYSIAHGIRDKNVLGFDPNMVLTFDDNKIKEQVALKMSNSSSVTEAMADPVKRQVFLKYRNSTNMVDIEKEVPKSQYSPENDIPTEHMKAVVKDIIDNWSVRSVNSLFHGIFATSSIKEAIMYYQLIKAENTNLKVTAIFDPSDDNGSQSIFKMNGITDILTDYKDMYGNSYEVGQYASFKKDACARLAHKKPYINIKSEDKLDLVIVVDQLLTGFDSKWINTLYLDKVLEGKNLIQAISRTNRLYNEIEKPFGTIFWYRYPHTMDKNLKDAVEDYSGSKTFGIFVNKLDRNIEGMNFKYKEIKQMFEDKGISNFDHNYDDMIWKREFAKRFVELTKYWEAAKIQGFNWKAKEYIFIEKDGTTKTFTCDIDELTYNTLLKRYKELFASTGPGGNTEVPFDINTHITEIQTDKIDNDYINAQFNIYKKTLLNGNQLEKEKALKELHNSFALLSNKEQKYAKLFLHALENGEVKLEDGKTFKDYITEYEVNDFNNAVSSIALGLGLNIYKLKKMLDLHLTSENINEFGRYDDLMNDLDIDKAKTYFEQKLGRTVTKREARMNADKEIRTFILNGGFDGEVI